MNPSLPTLVKHVYLLLSIVLDDVSLYDDTKPSSSPQMENAAEVGRWKSKTNLSLHRKLQ